MTERLSLALTRIDEANAQDPNLVEVDGESVPKELLYGRRMSERLAAFAPDACDAVKLASRAQHIQRWKIPRDTYATGRVGYLKWRHELKAMHAKIAGTILQDVGYEDALIERVGTMLMKKGLKTDANVQLLEDVACLVFLDHELERFAAQHPEEKVIDVLQKTWGKMSESGQQAALELDLGSVQALVTRALQP